MHSATTGVMIMADEQDIKRTEEYVNDMLETIHTGPPAVDWETLNEALRRVAQKKFGALIPKRKKYPHVGRTDR